MDGLQCIQVTFPVRGYTSSGIVNASQWSESWPGDPQVSLGHNVAVQAKPFPDDPGSGKRAN